MTDNSAAANAPTSLSDEDKRLYAELCARLRAEVRTYNDDIEEANSLIRRARDIIEQASARIDDVTSECTDFGTRVSNELTENLTEIYAADPELGEELDEWATSWDTYVEEAPSNNYLDEAETIDESAYEEFLTLPTTRE